MLNKVWRVLAYVLPIPSRMLLMMTLIGMVSTGFAVMPAAQARATDSRCNELQVVFIIDQSGSMFGTADLAPSDPESFREFGVAQAIDILSTLRYQSYPSATIRVAAVDFGDTVALRLPWTVLDAKNSESNRLLISEIMTTRGTRTESLGNTNFIAALQGAASLFSQVSEPSSGCPRRAVVLITDGQPAGPTITDEASHFAELTGFIDRYMSPSDHELFVIGLDAENRYWRDIAGYWARLVGTESRTRQVTGAPEMTSQMLQIVRTVTDALVTSGGSVEPLCLNDADVVVPPFVQQLRFTLVKNDRTRDRLQVFDGSGREVSALRGDVDVRMEGETEPIQTITVQAPEPGLWRVESTLPLLSVRNCQIQLLSFKANPALITPAPGTLAQFGRADVELLIVDADGGELPQYSDPKYTPSVELALVDQAGQSRVIPLVADPGTYRYRGVLEPVETGPVTLRVAGTSGSPTGGSVSIFDRALATFEVVPPAIELAAPITPQMDQYELLPISFATTLEGAPAELGDGVTVAASATVAGSTVDVPVQREAAGNFVAAFEPQLAGQYELALTVTGAGANGPQEIARRTVSLDVVPAERVDIRLLPAPEEGYVATDWAFQPTGLPLVFQITGEDGAPRTLSQLGIADLQRAVSVDVTPDGGQAVAGFQLQQSGSARHFVLSPNAFGAGCYAVTVTARQPPGAGYVWRSPRWTFDEVCGVANWRAAVPLILGGLLAVVVAVLLVAALLRALRPRPRLEDETLSIVRETRDPNTRQVTGSSLVRTIVAKPMVHEEVIASGLRGFFERWVSLPGAAPEPPQVRKLVITATGRPGVVRVRVIFRNNRQPAVVVLEANGQREYSLGDPFVLHIRNR
jgi:hypothetical protein